ANLKPDEARSLAFEGSLGEDTQRSEIVRRGPACAKECGALLSAVYVAGCACTTEEANVESACRRSSALRCHAARRADTFLPAGLGSQQDQQGNGRTN